MPDSSKPGSSPDGPSDFEKIRYLLDKYHEEVRLFWIRWNVLLLINAGAFTLILPRIDTDQMLSPVVLVSLAGAGVALSILWLVINHCSVREYRKWLNDAVRIAAGSDDLYDTFECSLFAVRKRDLSVCCKDEPRPWLYRTTTIVVSLILAGWVALAIYVLYLGAR